MSQLKAVVLFVMAAVLGLSLAVSRVVLAADPSPEGRWVTIDDDTKQAKSVVEIFRKGNKLHGKIVELIKPVEKDPKCTACKDARKDQPITGMEIIWDLAKDGTEWSGGYILDPNNGESYKCYIEVVEGGKKLKVRGYIGVALLGRTQYWQRDLPADAKK